MKKSFIIIVPETSTKKKQLIEHKAKNIDEARSYALRNYSSIASVIKKPSDDRVLVRIGK